jgi:hypothetical protein
MSRRDLRLNNVPTMRTAVIRGSGEFIPRSGDNRIAITDICHNGYRPVILRQDPLTGNPLTGTISKHFLGLPISGCSNFKSPVISDAGVSIYNATDSATQGAQNPVTDKVLISANYYYFSQEASYFDDSLRMRIRLTLSSLTLTKSELAGKYVEATIGAGSTLNIFRQTGFGESERVFADGDPYDLNPPNQFDTRIELAVISNIDMHSIVFQGSNNPTVQSSAYPNSNPQGVLRYNPNGTSVAAREWNGTIDVHPDTLEKGINYGSREIFVDIIVIV